VKIVDPPASQQIIFIKSIYTHYVSFIAGLELVPNGGYAGDAVAAVDHDERRAVPFEGAQRGGGAGHGARPHDDLRLGENVPRPAAHHRPAGHAHHLHDHLSVRRRVRQVHSARDQGQVVGRNRERLCGVDLMLNH